MTMTGETQVQTIYYEKGQVCMIDQRKLPLNFQIKKCSTVQEVHEAIKSMTIRGAPAIGAAGAYGLALAAQEQKGSSVREFLHGLEQAKDLLDSARPTAVNLSWATARILNAIKQETQQCNDLEALRLKPLELAQKLAEEDIEINRRIGQFGAEIVPANANILHHCNTGALATVDIGTAIGVIYECHKQNKGIHVWVDETRPRLQGARLTAWELMRAGVPLHLIADNAAGHLMQAGKVDVVLFGADRVAANGDVVNKIGTYKLAVVAKENKIPVFACVPTSTIDLNFKEGAGIPIEERSPEEVTCVGKERIAPVECPVFNPAFDITPFRYLTGIITEEGICYPPFDESLRQAVQKAEAKSKSM